jgi:hypothetical protein
VVPPSVSLIEPLLARVVKNASGKLALTTGDIVAAARRVLAVADGETVFVATREAITLFDVLASKSAAATTMVALQKKLIDPLLAHLQACARSDVSKPRVNRLAAQAAKRGEAWASKAGSGIGWGKK